MASEKTDAVENTTTEVNAIVHYKDAAGNVVKIYPQTKAENVTDLEDNYLKKSGGTMTGNLVLDTSANITNLSGSNSVSLTDTQIEMYNQGSEIHLFQDGLNIIGEDALTIFCSKYKGVVELGTPLNDVYIEGVITPTSERMAANKQYVDDSVSNITPLLITDNDIFEAVDYDNSITLFKKINTAVSNGINVYYSPLYDLEQDAAEIYVLTEWYGTEGTFVRVYGNTVYYAFISEGTPTVEITAKGFGATRRTTTLLATSWIASDDVYTQTVTVSGVSATETAQEIHITPAITSMSAYMETGIYAFSQSQDSISFKASEQPTVDIDVYILIRSI